MYHSYLFIYQRASLFYKKLFHLFCKVEDWGAVSGLWSPFHWIPYNRFDNLDILYLYAAKRCFAAKNGTWKGSFIADDLWEPYLTLSIKSIIFKRVWFISDMILWAFFGNNKQGNKVTQKFNAYLQYWSLVPEGTSQIGSQTGRGTQDNGLWPQSILMQIL